MSSIIVQLHDFQVVCGPYYQADEDAISWLGTGSYLHPLLEVVHPY